MKKEYLLGILFFGSLWGLSEAAFGELLYRFEIPYASIYLTAIGFSVLLVARQFLPGFGILSLIAGFAMLYKFLNTPFFACHLLGILLFGVSCDLFFNVVRLKNRYFNAILAVYLNYTLFALMITYVFRYEHWIEGGLTKIASHILISGSIAAMVCAVAVPLCEAFGHWLQSSRPHADILKPFAHLRLAMVTTGLWLLAVVIFLTQYHDA